METLPSENLSITMENQAHTSLKITGTPKLVQRLQNKAVDVLRKYSVLMAVEFPLFVVGKLSIDSAAVQERRCAVDAKRRSLKRDLSDAERAALMRRDQETIRALFYILDGNIYKCPSLHQVICSRLEKCSHWISSALNDLEKLVQHDAFTPQVLHRRKREEEKEEEATPARKKVKSEE